MAKPIEATPVLRGEDLRRLIEDTQRPDRGQNKRKIARDLLRRATSGGYY